MSVYCRFSNGLIFEMQSPSTERIGPEPVTSEMIKPVPKPFSIEALISDTGPNTKANSNHNQWHTSATVYNNFQHHISKDTDSEGSLDLDLAQDLSRHSQKDSKYLMISSKLSNGVYTMH